MFFNTCIPMVSPRMRNYQVSSCFLSVKGGKLDWLRIATQLKNCGNPQLIMSATDDIAHHQGVIDRVIWGNAMPASIKTLGNGANCYFSSLFHLTMSWDGSLPDCVGIRSSCMSLCRSEMQWNAISCWAIIQKLMPSWMNRLRR